MVLSEIISNLLIGNSNDAQNESENFDLIINCTENIPFYTKNEKIKLIRIEIKDLFEENDSMYNYFEFTSDLINEYLINNKKILVHCQQGMSRSVTIVAAYFIKYQNMNVSNVIKFLKSKRRESFFGNKKIIFETALNRYSLKYYVIHLI